MHDDNLVGALNGGQTVGDDQRRPPFHHAAQCVAHTELGLRIHAGSRFIENQNIRIVRQRAGKRNQLLLPGGERRAPFPHFFFESAGQGSNKFSEVYILRRLLHVPVLNARRPQPDISANRTAE